jgi:two-component system, NarL family, response regulator
MTTTSIPHPASHFEPTAGSGAVPLGLPINSPSDKMVNAKIRILIADDHPVIREGLVEVLTRQKDMSVIGEAGNGEEVCQLYDKLSPDILLLDLRMPKKDGLQVLIELMSRRVSKARIIVMSSYDSEQDICHAFRAGAKTFLAKDAHPQQIRETVRRVARGETFLPAAIASKLAQSIAHPELSERETHVLQYLAHGRSNKEIGRALFISEGTVKHHVKSLLRKLDAVGRAEAMAIAAIREVINNCE